MVHVTHDQVEALTLGDRIAVLDAGRVRQVGTPDEVYGRPRDRFVAGFLGSPSMNFLGPEAARSFCEIPKGTVLGSGRSTSGSAGRVRRESSSSRWRAAMPTSISTAGSWLGFQRTGPPKAPSRRRFDREAAHLFDEATGERREWQ